MLVENFKVIRVAKNDENEPVRAQAPTVTGPRVEDKLVGLHNNLMKLTNTILKNGPPELKTRG